jgi:hypothetical protein
MGKRINSLADAAHAAGFAMAPEDMYAENDFIVRHVMAPSISSTALVPYTVAKPAIGFMAHAKALATRYGSPGWLMPRLTA